MNKNTSETAWLAQINRLVAYPEPTASLRSIMQWMNDRHLGLIPLVEGDGTLAGVIVDGDLRRALVNGADLDAPAQRIANTSPIVLTNTMTRDAAEHLLVSTRKSFAPVIDANRRVLGIASRDDFAAIETVENPAVIFAGGFGKRLRPFTDELPKPMLPVGGAPIIMKVIESLVDHGVNNLHLLLHYLPEAFQEYFADKTFLGRSANLIIEDAPRGTAGGLVLLRDLYDHEASGAALTIGVSEYKITVPFGVLDTMGGEVRGVVEKPTYRWQTICSAYCVSPDALSYVPAEGSFDMPDLISALLEDNRKVRYFRVSDYQRIEEMVDSHSDIWHADLVNINSDSANNKANT
jgi:CBS domain-containing protein